MAKNKGLLMAVFLGTFIWGIACTQSSTATPEGTNVSPDGSTASGVGAPASGTSNTKTADSIAFNASQVSRGGQQSGIWVSGSGRVQVTPDLGLLTLGVEARADAVVKAREKAARAMESIMAALINAGAEEKDIRTQFFNIQPEYTYNELKRRQEITGYRVTNTVDVKIRNLETMGSLVDQVATAGGDLTRINSIRFTVEDTQQFASQARDAAVKQAIEKAKQFAELTGVTLGKLVYIAETGANVPVMRDFAFEERALMATAAPPTPGPAQGPRPASSTPAITLLPAPLAAVSSDKSGILIVLRLFRTCRDLGYCWYQ